MDISQIKSSLKAILPEEYSNAVFAWLEALQEWSDDDLNTMAGHPVQLDEPENALMGNTVALDLDGTHSGFPTETGQPIPKIGSYEDLGFFGERWNGSGSVGTRSKTQPSTCNENSAPKASVAPHQHFSI